MRASAAAVGRRRRTPPSDAAAPLWNRSITVQDSNGTDINMDFNSVCLSLEHPLVNSLVDSALNLPAGTNAQRPCVMPSPLDAFNEGLWYMHEYVDNGVFAALMTIGDLAAAAGLPGQTFDTRTLPSIYDINRTEIIRRLSDRPSHWLTSGSQALGKLYGNRTVDASDRSGLTDDTAQGLLTGVYSFNLRMYNDLPAEVVRSRQGLTGLTEDEFEKGTEGAHAPKSH